MFWRMSLVLLAATVTVAPSNAQMRGMMHGSGTHAGFARGAAGRIGRGHETRSFPRGVFPGSSYLYPDLYQDYYPDEQYADENAPPQAVIVRPAAVEDSSRKIKPGPLLIELQGDRYVRFGGAEEADRSGSSAHPDYAESASTKPPISSRQMSARQKEDHESSGAEPIPVVLVYRDGHHEEIPDYAIANGVIYVHGTYWQNGYWTKQIALSTLDPAATMQANQRRGVKFMLPSAPNVVIASF
jgi:hypothetical protein